jgi:hypothetical protein
MAGTRKQSKTIFSLRLLTSLQKDAILAIEETLHRRGDIAKIMGQPLHLIEPGPTVAQPKPPRKRKNALPAPKSLATIASSPVPSRAGSPQDGPSLATNVFVPVQITDGKPSVAKNAVPDASKAKRSSGVAATVPTAGTPAVSAKMAREAVFAQAQQCAVCGGTPFHQPKKCPEVQKGTTQYVCAFWWWSSLTCFFAVLRDRLSASTMSVASFRLPQSSSFARSSANSNEKK